MTTNKKNMLITGSSRGIGLETAKHFAENYNVYITGRNSEILKNLCEQHNFAGFVEADLFVEGAGKQMFKKLNKNIDILINNAGVYFYSPVENMTDDEIQKSVYLNMIAPFELIRAAVPYMKEQKYGRIINIGSISGVTGEAYASLYSMTKAALIGLTKATALELAFYDITVNIINPGWVDTELINNENLENEFSKEEILETVPQRRFVLPSEIAKTCEFLISDGAKSVTGQSVNICAGLSLGF